MSNVNPTTGCRQAKDFPKSLSGEFVAGTMTHDLTFAGAPSGTGTWTEERSFNPIQYRYEQKLDIGEVVFDLALSGHDNIGEGPILVVVTVEFGEFGKVLSGSVKMEIQGADIPVDEDTSFHERFLEAGSMVACQLFNCVEYARAEEEVAA